MSRKSRVEFIVKKKVGEDGDKILVQFTYRNTKGSCTR